MASIALANVWKAYLHSLETKPITTKTATGAVLTAIGDITAQLLLEQKHTIDFLRLGVLTGYGLLTSIIEGHYWLGYLEKVVGPSMGWKSSVKKMILDVGVFAPVEVAGCLSWTHVFERREGTLRSKLADDYFPTLVSSFFFWSPASLFGFLFVPFHLRVLYGTSVSLLWDTFLSYAAHNHINKALPATEGKSLTSTDDT